MITLREYTPEDYPLVKGWWEGHGKPATPPNLLSPIGVFALRDGEPVAAMWLYLALGCGLCWLEYPLTAPKQSLSQARESLKELLGHMINVAQIHNYALMLGQATVPLAREMKRAGFLETATGMSALAYLLEEVDHGSN